MRNPRRSRPDMRHPSVGRPGLLLSCLLMLAPAPASGQDDALFWSLRSDNREAGYLLGTIHSEDPRVVDFSEELTARLAGCEVFAMELVPDLPTLALLTERMQFQQAGMLKAQLGTERFTQVMEALLPYQVPPEVKANLKVWAAMMTLSVPPPQTGLFMDFSLSLRAAGAGAEVRGLETLDQQLAFLEEMPLEFQLQLLDQALAERAQVAEVHQRMVEAYLGGRLGPLVELSDQQMAVLDPQVRDYFIRRGIDERNQRMAEALVPMLRQGCVFAAVGALHLQGQRGLITLLRGQGFVLAPLAPPYRASP